MNKYIYVCVDVKKVKIYQMILNKLSYSGALTGVLLVLPVVSHAGSPAGLPTFQVGVGKVDIFLEYPTVLRHLAFSKLGVESKDHYQ